MYILVESYVFDNHTCTLNFIFLSDNKQIGNNFLSVMEYKKNP